MLRQAVVIALVAVLAACDGQRLTGPAAEVAVRRVQPLIGETEFPLVFVNGTEIAARVARTIPPETIESIEVVKGRAAIQAYGDRASVGVILIRTKAARPAPAP